MKQPHDEHENVLYAMIVVKRHIKHRLLWQQVVQSLELTQEQIRFLINHIKDPEMDLRISAMQDWSQVFGDFVEVLPKDILLMSEQEMLEPLVLAKRCAFRLIYGIFEDDDECDALCAHFATNIEIYIRWTLGFKDTPYSGMFEYFAPLPERLEEALALVEDEIEYPQRFAVLIQAFVVVLLQRIYDNYNNKHQRQHQLQ